MLARETGLGRESDYKSFSGTGIRSLIQSERGRTSRWKAPFVRRRNWFAACRRLTIRCIGYLSQLALHCRCGQCAPSASKPRPQAAFLENRMVMGPIVLSATFLLLSVWATALIVRLENATTTQKVIYIALIWLLPMLGAIIAYIASLRFRQPKMQTADSKMTEAVASKHQSRSLE